MIGLFQFVRKPRVESEVTEPTSRMGGSIAMSTALDTVQLTRAHGLAGAWQLPDGVHAQAPGAAELALLPFGRWQD